MLKSIQNSDKLEPEALKKQVLGKLKLDAEIIGKLNEDLKAFKPVYSGTYTYKDGECTYPLKFHKMSLALEGAENLVQSHFDSIFYDGKIPAEYDFSFNPNSVTVLGANNTSIFGNSKGTFLKTAALTTHLVCRGKTRLQESVTQHEYPQSSWIDSSVMTHVTTMPTVLKYSEMDSFTYAFSDPKTPQGFAFVHGGFTFGGHRSEGDRYTCRKYLGPEDCSSFNSKMTHSPCIYTTADQLLFYRAKVNEGVVNSDWLSGSPQFPALDSICEPVALTDPDRNIQPGQIYCHRRFDVTQDPKMLDTLGKSGHVGIVLGFDRNGKDSSILILAADRDMPNVEGVGIQSMPLYEEGKKVMLFSARAKAISTEHKIDNSTSHSQTPANRVPVRFN